jgi:hypothetical protein
MTARIRCNTTESNDESGKLEAIGTILESGVWVGAIVVVLILAVVGLVVATGRQP